jgi:hypothetical protein
MAGTKITLDSSCPIWINIWEALRYPLDYLGKLVGNLVRAHVSTLRAHFGYLHVLVDGFVNYIMNRSTTRNFLD